MQVGTTCQSCHVGHGAVAWRRTGVVQAPPARVTFPRSCHPVGATAGVLVVSTRARHDEVRQTAIGALAAGLLGGISEPSLYGIHLRYKRIYPRMLVGCLVGGLLTGILGWSSGGVRTGVFAFTSLLTIPVFSPMWVYAIAIAGAFFTAMFLVIVSDYRTPEQKAEEEAERAQEEADLALEASRNATGPLAATAPSGAAVAAATQSADVAVALLENPTEVIGAPVSGKVVALDDVND